MYILVFEVKHRSGKLLIVC